MFSDKKITLKHFFRSIAQWQKLYWAYDDALKKPCITAREVEHIYRQKSVIAEDVARFILDRHVSVEILNNELLDNSNGESGAF